MAHRARDVDEVSSHLEQLRREFPDASHHCWAYVLGDPESSSELKANDDGEPSGTAGGPILNVLRHKKVGDVLLVVVRYFGGTKLGAGGLVRAYSSTASGAMEALPLEQRLELRSGTLTVAYADEKNAKKWLEQAGAELLSVDYGESVHLKWRVAVRDEQRLRDIVKDRSGGRLGID